MFLKQSATNFWILTNLLVTLTFGPTVYLYFIISMNYFGLELWINRLRSLPKYSMPSHNVSMLFSSSVQFQTRQFFRIAVTLEYFHSQVSSIMLSLINKISFGPSYLSKDSLGFSTSLLIQKMRLELNVLGNGISLNTIRIIFPLSMSFSTFTTK